MKRDIIIVDVETGGLDVKHNALLSYCLKAFRKDELISSFVKNNLGLQVHDQAISTNKLDERLGITNLEAYQKIKEFLKLYNKPILAGKNVKFDIGFLEMLFKRFGDNLYSYIDYHVFEVDTLIMLDEIMKNTTYESLSLSNVCVIYGIESKWHTADGDVRATEELIEALIDKFKYKLNVNESLLDKIKKFFIR